MIHFLQRWLLFVSDKGQMLAELKYGTGTCPSALKKLVEVVSLMLFPMSSSPSINPWSQRI